MMEYEVVFTYIRYEILFVLVVLIGLTLNIVFLKERFINWLATIVISIICVVCSGFSVLTMAVLIDELDLSGESKDMYIFIAIIVLAITNSIISYIRILKLTDKKEIKKQ
ncbi:hypothetical protein CIL03_08665 [Virgibacillus indicus]|uniref:Uncharacterized protein n=1 Tax=Virgibacillus indicus TaxID=2024554 RepID=A0A265NAN1_9BACI|nr:hypothetical protein [Virgibacillus indicus]OZU89078.1 hypothetical protein CIL03_08665 [Virgibacillus indicus]